MTAVPLAKTFPVLEVFGPVVQGEGPVAGEVTHFVRFGLCDYRCSWCDSMFAVEPAEVKAHAEHLDLHTICDRLDELMPAPWVTLSGGNPAIHELGDLVTEIQVGFGMDVAVETQGSKWRDWLTQVDMLIVSPKPPSSGMATERHEAETERFMFRAEQMPPLHRAIKVVVFDEEDLAWADDLMVRYEWPRLFLSVGTDPPTPGETLEETRRVVCDRYRWLCEQLPHLDSRVAVYPQLHVLAYGHARGV